MTVRLSAFLLFAACQASLAQQAADSGFHYTVAAPVFARDAGPRVCVDEAHNNFHTVAGRYRPFADILRDDGFVVVPSRSALRPGALASCDILVISNALADRNVSSWSLPTPPAFSAEEIAVVRDWVMTGGALLLIADHMPFPGAIMDLAAAFGVDIRNGFTVDSIPLGRGGYVFRRSDGSLRSHAVVNGRRPEERVDSVAAGFGSAFLAPDFEPILVLSGTVVLRMLTVAWQFQPETPEIPVGGWLQGGVRRFAKGRVAVFGKAGMFSAQLTANGNPNGMNHPLARQNPQFLLNLMHWLAGVLP